MIRVFRHAWTRLRLASVPAALPSKQNALENSARSAHVDDEAKAEESRGPKP